MSFRKVASQTQYYKLDECEEGQVLVTGIYVGIVPGKFGDQFLFREGSKRVVLSGGHLKYLLEQEANPGDVVRVTYGGKEKLSSGKFKGKPCHRFELEIEDNESNNEEDESPKEKINKSTSRENGSDKENHKENHKESPKEKAASKSKTSWVEKGKATKVSKSVSPEVEEEDLDEETAQVETKGKTKGRPRKAPVVEEEEYDGDDIEL